MRSTVADPLVGQVLEGRYQVSARLAVGGMATVYLALDHRLDRMVALKVMHAELAADPEFVGRFIREARSAARLSHPNIVAVYDQGNDRGRVFLAMEYIEGQTLRDVLRGRPRLTPREAFTILEPVLAALGAAHAAGFVHRDVKPENVLLADDGRVKVADFGLVRTVSTATDTMADTMAGTGTVLGTVSYLAPEQIQRGVADPRSDVYAAGIVLYEMLTGEKPHDGDNPLHVVYQHVNSDVPPPSSRLPGLSPAIDGLVQAATSRDPDGRPTDAAHFLAALHNLRRNLTDPELDFGGGFSMTGPATTQFYPQVNQHTAMVPPGSGFPPMGQHEVLAGEEFAPARRPRGPAAFVTVLILAVLASGVAWWYGSGRFVPAPAVLNLNQAQATARISDAGLHVQLARQFSETVPAGLVAATRPGPNQRVVRGGAVTIFLSAGPQRIAVPDVAGRSIDDAQQEIRNLGLPRAKLKEQFDDQADEGTVIGTQPDTGTRVRPNTEVVLLVSKGPAPINVPDVVGRSLVDAQILLQQAGLAGEVAGQESSNDVAAGLVARQDPPADANADNGATVRLFISAGPQLVQVPDVRGQSRNDARRLLRDAGFDVRTMGLPGRGGNGNGGGQVFAQFPTGGSQAAKGSTVTITLF